MNNNFTPHQNIHWFPGHMTKTFRVMEKDIHNVDAVVKMLDARIPHSSINPEIERITAIKPSVYILNKADLADPVITNLWIQHFHDREAGCVAISSLKKNETLSLKKVILNELTSVLEKRKRRGMDGSKPHIMVTGIPNVGKSTFINTFCGESRAKAADKPGVTRGKQWISSEYFELLDMPGVLWKKFDNIQTASNLAFIGSIKDDVLDIEELAAGLLSQVKELYPQKIKERYKLSDSEVQLPIFELIEAIGRKRGMLVRGGEVDTERCSIMIVDEFRASKWGRISLEKPEVVV